MNREEKMEAMYRDAHTLQEIGDEFGISRERVRQILRRRGVETEAGGAYLRTKRATAVERQLRERRCINRWGYGVERMKEFRAMDENYHHTPPGQYIRQRQDARDRGIPWRLTFKQWWEFWEASGLYPLRGRGYGKYCMARKGDEGAYEVGNIFVHESIENATDGHAPLVTKGGRLNVSKLAGMTREEMDDALTEGVVV